MHKKFVVSDMHIGTTMWQRSMLLHSGAQVITHTLSSHSQYLDRNLITESATLDRLQWIDQNKIEFLLTSERGFMLTHRAR
jgi:hypothetical protein